jgi:thiamine monophosphate synthase
VLESTGADYVLFGPVWNTATHPQARPLGLDALRSVALESKIPVIAIGGVTRERIPDVLAVCAGYASITLFA